MACLIEAFRTRGMPRRIAVRQGQFRSRFSPLDVWLIEHDIVVEPSVGDHATTLASFEPVLRGLRAEILDQRFRTFGAAAEALALWAARANRDISRADADEAAPNGAGVITRRYIDDVIPFDYEPHDIIRRVQERGRVSLFGRIVRVPKSFRGKDVAFRPTPQGGSSTYCFERRKSRLSKSNRYPTRQARWISKPKSTMGGRIFGEAMPLRLIAFKPCPEHSARPRTRNCENMR